METTLSKRLSQLIEYTVLSTRVFEIECGIGNGTISKVVRTNTSLSQDTIDKIATKYPKINTMWLTRGEGKMVDTTTPSNGSGIESTLRQKISELEAKNSEINAKYIAALEKLGGLK